MIEVGQSIWIINRNETGLKEYKVSKVGKKYFYTDGFRPLKIDIETLKVVS